MEGGQRIYKLGVFLLLFTCVIYVVSTALITPPWADDWIFIGRATKISSGLEAAAQRLSSWSPRPASELTIFTVLPLSYQFGIQPERISQPLLVVAYLQSIFIACWPLLHPQIRRERYQQKIFVSLAAVSVATISLKINVAEIFFWGCGAAAYLPAFAAWISACVLWEDGGEKPSCIQILSARLSLCQLGIACLFWEGSLIPFLILPLTVRLFTHIRSRATARRLSKKVFRQYLCELVIILGYSAPALINGGRLRLFHTSERGLPNISAGLDSIQANLSTIGSSFTDTIQHTSMVSLVATLASGLALVNYWRTQTRRVAPPAIATGLLICSSSFWLIFLLGKDGLQQRYTIIVIVYFLSAFAIGLGWLGSSIRTKPSKSESGIYIAISKLSTLTPLLLFICILATDKLRSTALKTNFFRNMAQREYLEIGKNRVSNFQNRNDSVGEGLIDQLPTGIWDVASAEQQIKLQEFGRKYRYKIIKGILIGYKIDTLRITNKSDRYSTNTER